jgi:hypothetical protein
LPGFTECSATSIGGQTGKIHLSSGYLEGFKIVKTV